MLFQLSKKNKLIHHNDITLRIRKLLGESKLDEGVKLFLESLQRYYQERNGLTKKQFNALSDIELINLERGSEKHSKWAREYSKEKKEIAQICAKYYKANPPYFAHMIDKVLNDDKFIPTQSQYLSLCQNKYAKKVLEATFSDPLFKVGELVQGRTSAPSGIKDKLAVVISINLKPVIRAAKGTKQYSVLPIGDDKLIECEERHLKKAKKNKKKA